MSNQTSSIRDAWKALKAEWDSRPVEPFRPKLDDEDEIIEEAS